MAQQNTNTKSQKLIDNPAAVKQITKKAEFFARVAKSQASSTKLLKLFYNLCPSGNEKKLFIAILEVTHPELKELTEFLKKYLYDVLEGTVSAKRPDGTRTVTTKYMGNGLPTITTTKTIKEVANSSNLVSMGSSQKQGLLLKIIKAFAKGLKQGLGLFKTKGANVSKVSAEEIKNAQPQKTQTEQKKATLSPEARLANTVSKPSHEDYAKLLSENSGFQTEPQQTTAREATEIKKEPTKELPSFLRIKKNERNRFGKSYSGSKKAYISAPQKQC